MQGDAIKPEIKSRTALVQLDYVLLDRLAFIERGALATVALIALVTLCGWLIPAVGAVLPAGWTLMQSTTALAALGSVLSLYLSQPRRSHRSFLLSRIFAGLVALLCLAILLEYLLNIVPGVESLFTASGGAVVSARMSPQSLCFFVLLSVVMAFIRTRRRPAAYAVDLLVFSLCLLVLVIGSGHLFGASHLAGSSAIVRVSPQTLICLMLLAYVALWCRAEYGIFAILVGLGIGSKIARIACPFALLLPFLLEIGRSLIAANGWMSTQYASALTTSTAAMLAFGLVLILAWRINTLEKEIHDLSLNDELTHVNNRRGFYVLATQALHLAQRSRNPFSVLFIDLDDLKQINDTLGHDTGSYYLCELAGLLERSFRKSDVIGRIGGDEFAVAAECSESMIHLTVQRLESATAEWNAQFGRQHELSFSFGYVTSDLHQVESLDDLLGKADSAMYRTKRDKKLLRDSDPARPAFKLDRKS